MKRLGPVAVFSMVSLVAWQMLCRPPQEVPCSDPWKELVETLDTEAKVVDAKIARWLRFKAVRDDVDRALVFETMPLRTAAERVLAVAHADYPVFLEIAEHHGGQDAARNSLASVAKFMVHGYWFEMHVCGNRRRLDPKLLQRLEHELTELSMDVAANEALSGVCGMQDKYPRPGRKDTRPGRASGRVESGSFADLGSNKEGSLRNPCWLKNREISSRIRMPQPNRAVVPACFDGGVGCSGRK